MNDSIIPPPSQSTAFQAREVLDTNPIPPLAQRSMFWRPTYVAQSAWLEHIPFAFWLVETHHPRVLVELGTRQAVAYFAFCQGINRLGLNTRCFAVDPWKAEEDTFATVQAHNDAQYSGFSSLVRSTFDDALESFGDASIDLLHIAEPHHDYGTAKSIVEAWLRKLSSTAVVVLNGTNIRDQRSGMCQLFNELKTQYPSFEFSHGQGLGVVGVGKEQRKILNRLFDIGSNDASTQVIREVFSRLGRACADSVESAQHQIKANELTRLLESQRQLCQELKISLGETQQDLESRKREVSEIKDKLQKEIEQRATERGQLNERVTLLQEARGELKEDVSRLQAKLDTALVRLAEKGQEVTRLALESAGLQRQIDSYGGQIKDRDRQLTEKDQLLTDAAESVGQLKYLLARKEDEAKAASEHMALLTTQAEAQRGAAAALEAANRQLQEARDAGVQQVVERDRALAEAARQLREHEAQAEAQRGAAAALEAANKALQESNQAKDGKLEERFKELAILTQLLVARDGALLEKQQEMARLKKSFSWKMTAPVRTMERAFKKRWNGSGSIRRQISLIMESGLFDPQWYLEKYPDVARNNKDPAEHYLRYGAFEGRDPGPGFNTAWYLEAYKDVAEHGGNPLVHFIQFGKREGRQPTPKKEGQ